MKPLSSTSKFSSRNPIRPRFPNPPAPAPAPRRLPNSLLRLLERLQGSRLRRRKAAPHGQPHRLARLARIRRSQYCFRRRPGRSLHHRRPARRHSFRPSPPPLIPSPRFSPPLDIFGILSLEDNSIWSAAAWLPLFFLSTQHTSHASNSEQRNARPQSNLATRAKHKSFGINTYENHEGAACYGSLRMSMRFLPESSSSTETPCLTENSL
jgi:hypothetical protein